MRVKHFRPNLGSFFRGSTYTRIDLYASIYGMSFIIEYFMTWYALLTT